MAIKNIRSSREFELQVAALGEDLRQTIAAQCPAFPLDTAAQAVRLAQVADNFQFFAQTYFPHYVRSASFSLFQQHIFANAGQYVAGDDTQHVYLAPRGEAKSTYITRLLPLWCVINASKRMIVVVMDSCEQAVEMLEGIRAELDSNPRLQADYPDITGSGKVWKTDKIITRNNIKIRSAGSGKRLRGMTHGAHRPDLVVLDDVENDENVRKKSQRDKVRNWIDDAVLNLAPPGGGMDVIWVGTSLHYDAAINRASRSTGWTSNVFRAIETMPAHMDLWDVWEQLLAVDGVTAATDYYSQHQRAMEKGAVVSWPAVRPLLRLMTIRARNHASFEREFQNAPGNTANAPFATLTFYTKLPAGCVCFGAIDPSLGKNQRGDPSAILVGAWHRQTRTLYVVAAEIARRVPRHQIQRVIALQQQFGCVLWFGESVQFQAFFNDELVREATLQGVSVPLNHAPNSIDKDMRIMSLEPYINQQKIQFNREHATLIEQLTHYPEADHDDAPDALEMLWRAAQHASQQYNYTPVDRYDPWNTSTDDWD